MSYEKKIVEARHDYVMLNLVKGQDYDIAFNQQDAAGATVDLTTYTASLKLFDAEDVEVEELTSGASRITLAATDPNITLIWSDTNLDSYTTDALYKGDLLLIDGSGKKPAEYAYRIHARVTRGYL